MQRPGRRILATAIAAAQMMLRGYVENDEYVATPDLL
jgi:hypothetical protein